MELRDRMDRMTAAVFAGYLAADGQHAPPLGTMHRRKYRMDAVREAAHLLAAVDTALGAPRAGTVEEEEGPTRLPPLMAECVEAGE